MFKQNFINLCNKKGVAPSAVCMKLGLSNAIYSKWTDESIPHRATLQRIADYFGVTINYLLGKENEPTAVGGELVDPNLEEILEIMSSLSPERQQEALNYLKFLANSEGKK